MPLLPSAPPATVVMSAEGYRIATYDHPAEGGAQTAPVVLAVHGFASSAYANWQATGWVRVLGRAGYRVISFDQRGHGASDKPHEPGAYTMEALVADAEAVIETYLLDEVVWVGYSLGARVGWHAAIELPHRISRAVFGGIPDGDPLTRFRVDQARAFLESGTPVDDRLTMAYLKMAGSIRGNDLEALVSLVEGMRGGAQPDPAQPPGQPVLFATGSEDRILDASRALAEACPAGQFLELAGRNHFNAPTSREFRSRALAFLAKA